MADGEELLEGPSVDFVVAGVVSDELAARGLPNDGERIMGSDNRFTRETLDNFLLTVRDNLSELGWTYAYKKVLAKKGLLLSVSTLVEKISQATTQIEEATT